MNVSDKQVGMHSGSIEMHRQGTASLSDDASTVVRQLEIFIVMASLACLNSSKLEAAVIGINAPARSLTLEVVEGLPVEERGAWIDYLERSRGQLVRDQNALQEEIERANLSEAIIPLGMYSTEPISLHNKTLDQLSTPEALRIANIIVSFQTPSGGWSKNLDFTERTRLLGEHFAAASESDGVESGSWDKALVHWRYVGTYDNHGTIIELRYLASVAAAADQVDAAIFRESVAKGLNYVLSSQLPNGGWPQVWPLIGGYHDYVTFNDKAMIRVLGFLHDVARGAPTFEFLSDEQRSLARDSFRRGLECVIDCQVIADGRRLVWCQQHDMVTLRPGPGRRFEMPALASTESASVLLFLMSLGEERSVVAEAVHCGIQWFREAAIYGRRYAENEKEGRRLVADEAAGPIWARFYDISGNRPVFGDRDGRIVESIDQLSGERRNGYRWYSSSPKQLFQEYEKWLAEGLQ